MQTNRIIKNDDLQIIINIQKLKEYTNSIKRRIRTTINIEQNIKNI